MSLHHRLIDRLLNRFAVNSSRVHLERVNRDFAATVSADSLVLDAGAGDAPYRPLFAHARYESADFEMVDKPYAKTTYVCDLCAIPVQDARFDAIIFNQVMEHLPDPAAALRELHRVLKPGGRMIATAPLFYEEHEVPYDFYRYTQFGWRHLMAQAGFVIERLDWLEGYFGTVAYQLDTAARYLPLRPGSSRVVSLLTAPLLLLCKLAFAALAILFYRIDIRVPYAGRGFPKNYALVVRRD